MRLARSAQLEIGAGPIEDIHISAKSRDDIPAILIGLQRLYASKALLAPQGVRAARVRGEPEGAQGHRAAGHGPLAHPGAGGARACRFVLRGDRRALSDRHQSAAGRDALRASARLADGLGLEGWCQQRHLSRRAEKRSGRVRASRRSNSSPERVERYLSLCRCLAGRAEATLACELQGYLVHARRQLDQARRRLLGGEKIPHEEKVLSIFEPHTRWVAEGKAGINQELGVPAGVVEDRRRFILHRRIMRRGGFPRFGPAASTAASTRRRIRPSSAG